MSKNRKTGRFSHEEDTRLLQYLNNNGIEKWNDVAAHVETRDAKQCRERYYGHLAHNVNKEPFTKKEEDRICELFRNGYGWANIARELGNGRTSNNVKNLWYQKLSKGKKEGMKKKNIKKSFVKSETKARSHSSSERPNNKMHSNQLVSNVDTEQRVVNLNDEILPHEFITPHEFIIPHAQQFYETLTLLEAAEL
ncbi:12194_t:CDS:2 [Acaulospora morrowiae]|uniref:12194_t:CDS:1 n=1 Tax=Acaulospora morrowiae TaxID=94023 RepID=A0A9N9D818_9GLOM|nr:12194_t:CDS:2 [Acaulospora morrowiae]